MSDIIPKKFVDEFKRDLYKENSTNPDINAIISRGQVIEIIDALVEKYNKREDTHYKLDLNKEKWSVDIVLRKKKGYVYVDFVKSVLKNMDT